jgi:cell division protein FtsA
MVKRDLIVGLDIGTTKICVLVAEVHEDGIDVVGIGRYPSRGLRKGVVVDIESTIQSIKKAVEEAETMAGVDIDSVYVGIGGGHIKGLNSTGIVKIRDREVVEEDVERVLETAKAVDIPTDRQVLHVLPQGYIIDGQDGIKDPVGLVGVRLEARVHIVTGAMTATQNIIKCANSAGLSVQDMVLEQLASSEAVLTDDEKELGVVLVDIGGGTSSLAIFCEGSVRHTSVLGLGGNQITNDLAVGLRTPIGEAEEIKKRWGCCRSSMVMSDEEIEVADVGGRGSRKLSRRVLADIIEPRVAEIFTLLKREIHASSFEEMIAAGVVLTGGSAELSGIVELAQETFELPCRVGAPRGVGGLVDVVNNPQYATAVGLVLYARRMLEGARAAETPGNVFQKLKKRLRTWFEGRG